MMHLKLEVTVIVLVNSDTVSAGDALTYLLSKYNNVTIMGFTTSNNSCQSVGGIIFLTNGDIVINYPIYKMLDLNNNVFIDPDKYGNPTIELDIKIPITKDNIYDIFYNYNDYALEYAKNYFNK